MSISAKALLDTNNQPSILLNVDSTETGGSVDILHKFVEMLNDPNYVFNVMAYLSEELAVKPHELPNEFHTLKELDMKAIPQVYKKEKVNVLIRFVNKDKLQQKS